MSDWPLTDRQTNWPTSRPINWPTNRRVWGFIGKLQTYVHSKKWQGDKWGQYYSYWKCNLPMTRSVRLLAGRSVNLSVIISLKTGKSHCQLLFEHLLRLWTWGLFRSFRLSYSRFHLWNKIFDPIVVLEWDNMLYLLCLIYIHFNHFYLCSFYLIIITSITYAISISVLNRIYTSCD